MSTFTWKIDNLERLVLNGFVSLVNYSVDGVDGQYKSTYKGVIGYNQEEQNFTPYAQLTEEQVIGWVQNSLGKDAIEANLQIEIDALKTPTQATGMPW